MNFRLYFISRKTNCLSHDVGFSKVMNFESKAKLDNFLHKLLEEKKHRFRRNLIVIKAFCNFDNIGAQKHFQNYNALREYLEHQDTSLAWWEMGVANQHDIR